MSSVKHEARPCLSKLRPCPVSGTASSSAGSRGPPRPHGAVLFDRRVSFLELFYDLVYVAVIGQASHQLAEHIRFAVLSSSPSSSA